MVALAVMAERVGWRVMLPCASSPVPSRAIASATSPLSSRASGLTSAGPRNTRPRRKSRPPSATNAKTPDRSPAIARAIMTAPAIVMPRPMRCDLSPAIGRSTSSGVTRLALNAGISPASSVTPTPSTTEVMTRAGEIDRRAEHDVEELLVDGPGPVGNDHAQEIAQDQAQGRAHETLHQALAHDQADDRAPARADRAQHPDVVAPLRDDGAKGVEDDERAHEQRQEAEDVERGPAPCPWLAKISEPLPSAFMLKVLPSCAWIWSVIAWRCASSVVFRLASMTLSRPCMSSSFCACASVMNTSSPPPGDGPAADPRSPA